MSNFYVQIQLLRVHDEIPHAYDGPVSGDVLDLYRLSYGSLAEASSDFKQLTDKMDST